MAAKLTGTINNLTVVYNEVQHTANITNINAGFDETSYILDDKFPNATIKAFDFYDAEKHTEASIKRARKVCI